MADYQILSEGYDAREPRGWRASPTTVLMRDGGNLLLADPGSNPQRLRAALAAAGIAPDAIDLIFLTHCHPDHFLNIRLFPDTPVMDSYAVNEHDLVRPHRGRLPDGYTCTLLPTPGHSPDHCALLIPTEQGMVAVAGDAIWWCNGEEQNCDRATILGKRDPFAVDRAQLRASREALLAAADLIIPGHGRPFATGR